MISFIRSGWVKTILNVRSTCTWFALKQKNIVATFRKFMMLYVSVDLISVTFSIKVYRNWFHQKNIFFQVLHSMTSIIQDLVLGELQQMKILEKDPLNKYLNKTYNKTASLIANSCKSVAQIAVKVKRYLTFIVYFYTNWTPIFPQWARKFKKVQSKKKPHEIK